MNSYDLTKRDPMHNLPPGYFFSRYNDEFLAEIWSFLEVEEQVRLLEFTCSKIIVPTCVKYHQYKKIQAQRPDLLHYVKKLEFYHGDLTILPELPPNLVELFCHNNWLFSLTKLPGTLKKLYCDFSNL